MADCRTKTRSPGSKTASWTSQKIALSGKARENMKPLAGEGKHVVNESAGKQVANESAGKHVANESAGKHVASGKREKTCSQWKMGGGRWGGGGGGRDHVTSVSTGKRASIVSAGKPATSRTKSYLVAYWLAQNIRHGYISTNKRAQAKLTLVENYSWKPSENRCTNTMIAQLPF